MIITTTQNVEGRPITYYRGIVGGKAIMGANIFCDFFAPITDVVGGRSGADAVVGVDLDYEVVGDSMLMVSASGTAVVLAAK